MVCDTFDTKKGDTLRTGGFFNAHNYARATAPTVIQIHGMGPFAITDVNPTDDPRNKTSEKK